MVEEVNGKKWVVKIGKFDSPHTSKIKIIEKYLESKDVLHIPLIESGINELFSEGYSVYDYMEGKDADEILGNKISYEDYYEKLGILLKKVHGIHPEKFGDLVNTNKMFDSYIELLEHHFKRDLKDIDNKDLKDTYIKFSQKILKVISGKSYVSTLCHCDLSAKNIRINHDEFVILDWDNAEASIPEADIGTMRYWAYFSESPKQHQDGWKAFIAGYGNTNDDFEYRIWIHEMILALGLIPWHLKYDVNESELNKALSRLRELE